MKVAPGMHGDYLKMEKAYKKMHAEAKKAGKMAGWALLEVISPAGTNTEYNYVARNTFSGEEQLANYMGGDFYDEKWESVLTKEEMALVERTEQIRSMVKVEVWSMVDGARAKDWETAKVAVFNYFDSPEGKTRTDHFNMEKEIWKPVHQARVDDGKMKGWVLLNLEFPFGASMPYNSATVDLYTDMKEYFTPWFEDYFKKVHPGKNLDELEKRTMEAATLTKGEVRMLLDRLD